MVPLVNWIEIAYKWLTEAFDKYFLLQSCMVLVLILKFFKELCGENAENGKEATNYGKMKKKNSL